MRARGLPLAILLVLAWPLAAAAGEPYLETVEHEGMVDCSARVAPGPGAYNMCGPAFPGADVAFDYDAQPGLTSIAVELVWTPGTTGAQRLALVLAHDVQSDGPPLPTAGAEGSSDTRTVSGASPLLLVVAKTLADVQSEGAAYQARVAFPEDAGPHVAHGQPFTLRVHAFYYGAPLPADWLPTPVDDAQIVVGVPPAEAAPGSAQQVPDVAGSSRWPEALRASSYLVGLVAVTAPVMLAGRLRSAFWAAFLPFFSRLDEDRVLDHPRRAQLSQLVRAQPGLPADEVRRRASLANGPFEYHLALLVRRGIVQRQELDGRVYLWPAGRPVGRPGDSHLAPAQRVLEAVRRQPGLGPTELARLLGLAPKTARYHTRNLARRGRLRLEEDGARVRCWPVA